MGVRIEEYSAVWALDSGGEDLARPTGPDLNAALQGGCYNYAALATDSQAGPLLIG